MSESNQRTGPDVDRRVDEGFGNRVDGMVDAVRSRGGRRRLCEDRGRGMEGGVGEGE